jgi:ATP-dependent RNA helicase DDX31/DBP7
VGIFSTRWCADRGIVISPYSPHLVVIQLLNFAVEPDDPDEPDVAATAKKAAATDRKKKAKRAEKEQVQAVSDREEAASQPAAPSSTFGTRKAPAIEAEKLQETDPKNAMSDALVSTASSSIFAKGCDAFNELGLSDHLVSAVTNPLDAGGMNLKVRDTQPMPSLANLCVLQMPTRIQVLAIPHMLAGRDVMVNSQTGSGKTLTYLLPVVQSLRAVQPHVCRTDGTVAIVLAPTRELCLQILEVLQLLLRCAIWLVPGIVTGGEQRKKEKARLRKGVNILIATPGRLLDHVQNTQAFVTSKLRWLVLDEADRLLDMGFEKQVLGIIDFVKKQKQELSDRTKEKACEQQTLLLSATINSSIKRLAKISLTNPVMVNADLEKGATPTNGDSTEGAAEQYAVPDQLKQHFVVVQAKIRLPVLVAFLRTTLSESVGCKLLVFVSCCDSVDFHYALFDAMRTQFFGIGRSSAACLLKLHGNMSQVDRREAYRNFVRSQAGGAVLFCTDVAARGLDLPAVDWIVQYDPPQETADYVHRIGRTARRGRQGRSLLFLQPSEQSYLQVLGKHAIVPVALSMEAMLQKAACAKPSSEGDSATTDTTHKYGVNESERLALASARSLGHASRLLPAEIQRQIQEATKSNPDMLKAARAAFQSSIRAYAAHSAELKTIFEVRALHFGHMAKSFGLSEAPKSVSGLNQKTNKKASAGTKGNSGRAPANSKAAGGNSGKRKAPSQNGADVFKFRRQSSTGKDNKKQHRAVSEFDS